MAEELVRLRTLIPYKRQQLFTKVSFYCPAIQVVGSILTEVIGFFQTSQGPDVHLRVQLIPSLRAKEYFPSLEGQWITAEEVYYSDSKRHHWSLEGMPKVYVIILRAISGTSQRRQAHRLPGGHRGEVACPTTAALHIKGAIWPQSAANLQSHPQGQIHCWLDQTFFSSASGLVWSVVQFDYWPTLVLLWEITEAENWISPKHLGPITLQIYSRGNHKNAIKIEMLWAFDHDLSNT